jgi:hypothetical protein
MRLIFEINLLTLIFQGELQPFDRKLNSEQRLGDCKTNEIVDMLEEEAEESVLLANDRLAYWQDGQLLDWNFG